MSGNRIDFVDAEKGPDRPERAERGRGDGNLRNLNDNDASAVTLTSYSRRNSRSRGNAGKSASSSREPSMDRQSRKWRASMVSMDNFSPYLNRSLETLKVSHKYISQELDNKWMTGVLIVCFFTSGLIDSVAFNSWNCFVGMQTGNTVFAALGLTGQPKASHFHQYFKSLVSIGSFCLGTIFFNGFHRIPTGLFTGGPCASRRRWVLAWSFIVQAAMILTAGVLVYLDRVSNQPFVSGTFSSGTDGNKERAMVNRDKAKANYYDLTPVALLAFQAAGQVALSRVMGVIELPTIVLSTLYHDFTMDLWGLPDIWKRSPTKKDFFLRGIQRQAKRLGAIIALFLGGIVGGLIYKSPAGMAAAIWVAAALKGGIALSFFLWKKDPSEESALPR